MGIQGLFKLLKPIIKERNLKEFEGQTCAIDVMWWLYKGVYSCSYEVANNNSSFNYLAFPLKMIKLLQSYKIKPICVFDGMHLNAKYVTEKCRAVEKLRNKDRAHRMDKRGDHEEAKKLFGKSMVISTEMIDLFTDILQKLDIEVVIAPYEADSQISYLVRSGIADFGVSEDSDIVVFGWPHFISKLKPTGDCDYIHIDDLWDPKVNSKIQDKSLKELAQLNHVKFIIICIMSGWDYLPGIDRMGLKTGIKQYTKFKSLHSILEVPKIKEKLPKFYEQTVEKVRDLFLYQTVYDPKEKIMKPLNPVPEDREIDQEFLGKYIDESILELYSQGLINKKTLEPRKPYEPDIKQIKMDMDGNDISVGTFYYLHSKYDFTKKDEEETKKREDRIRKIKFEKGKQFSITQFTIYRRTFT